MTVVESTPPCTCCGRGSCTMCVLGEFAGEQTAAAVARGGCQLRRDRDFGGRTYCRLPFGHAGGCLFEDCGCVNVCHCTDGGDRL